MADRTLIETLARALWLEDAKRWDGEMRALGRIEGPGKIADPTWYDQAAAMPLTGPGFRRKWEGQARAALQTLVEEGPTPEMRVAFYDEETCMPNGSADGFRAAIRAAIRAALGAEAPRVQTPRPDAQQPAEPLAFTVRRIVHGMPKTVRRFVETTVELGAREGACHGIDIGHVEAVVVAEDDAERLVGCLTAYRINNHELLIQWVYVSPSARRQGVGKAMADELIRTWGSPVTAVKALVLVGNGASEAFHRSLGMAPYATMFATSPPHGADREVA